MSVGSRHIAERLDPRLKITRTLYENIEDLDESAIPFIAAAICALEARIEGVESFRQGPVSSTD